MLTALDAALSAQVNLLFSKMASAASGADPEGRFAKGIKNASSFYDKAADIIRNVVQTLGEDTVKVMADGCICLAQLWDSAWQEGDGDSNIRALGAVSEPALERLYQNADFLPSHTLNTIGPLLQGAPAPVSSRRQSTAPEPARRRRRA